MKPNSTLRNFILAAGMITVGSGICLGASQSGQDKSSPRPALVHVSSEIEPSRPEPLLRQFETRAKEVMSSPDELFVAGGGIMLAFAVIVWVLKKKDEENDGYEKRLAPGVRKVISELWPIRDNRLNPAQIEYLDMGRREFFKYIIKPLNNPPKLIVDGDARLKGLMPEAAMSLAEGIVRMQERLEEGRRILKKAGYLPPAGSKIIPGGSLWDDLRTAGLVRDETFSGRPILHAEDRSKFVYPGTLPRRPKKPLRKAKAIGSRDSDEDDDEGGRPWGSPDKPIVPAMTG